MRIRKIELVNFRQFYGKNELEFSQDPEMNVTLVHGENGVGKTTILNSIIWCLFEKFNSDFERPKEIVSYEALAEGKNSARVELTFENEDCEYVAMRKFDNLTKQTTFKVWQVVDYDHKDIPSPKAFINSVLPEHMSPYFFFHGEGISQINDKRKGSEFLDAIRNILGFTFAEQAIKDLSKIKKTYTKQASNLEERNSKLKEALEKKYHTEKKIEQIEEKREVISSLIKEQEVIIETNESKLANSNNEDVKRLQTMLAKEKNNKMALDNDYKRLLSDRTGLIQKYGIPVYGAHLGKRGISYIDDSNVKGRIPSPYQETFIKDLIEKAQCICGRDLVPGTDPYDQVYSLLETANTALINQKVMKARAAGGNLEGKAAEFVNELEKHESSKSSLESRIGISETEIRTLKSQLDNIDEDDVQVYKNALRSAETKRDQLLIEEGQYRRELGIQKELLEKHKRTMSVESSGSKEIEKYNKAINLIDSLSERCSSRLFDFEQKSRRTISDDVNLILEEFSRKAYKVKVDDNFEFNMVRQDGGYVAKSKGENLLLNLSFVSALIGMARKRKNASGNFFVKGAVAPFVIDAPFGELDETYKEATANFLPASTDQLILLLSSSHWKGTVEKVIKEKIGAEYILVSMKKGPRGSKPKDMLEINEKSYELSQYDAEVDMTKIVRVK